MSKHAAVMEAITSAIPLPPDEALPILTVCAKKGQALAAVRAIKAIGAIHHPHVPLVLVDLYQWCQEVPSKRDKACDLRTAIAEALGNTGSPLGIDPLRMAVTTVCIGRVGPGLEDLAIPLRATAAIALAKVDIHCLYYLSTLLFDHVPDVPTSPIAAPYAKAGVRQAAAQAIRVLGDEGGIPLLAVKLKFPGEEVPEVLGECLESMIAMNPPYVMEVAKPYLVGNDGYISALVALSLAENLGLDALTPLIEAIDHVEGDIKEAMVIAISVIRDRSIRQVLLDLLEHPSPFVRRGAVQGLKSYLDAAVVARLGEV